MISRKECQEPFTEIGADLGTHEPGWAVGPVTVDAFHSACCEEALLIEPAEDHLIVFKTDERGFMNQCLHRSNVCGGLGCEGGPLGLPPGFEVLAFGAPPAP